MNKLVDEYNIIYHRSITYWTYYYALTKEIELSHKAPKFKVGDRVRIRKYKNNFTKGNVENCWRKIFVIDYMLKTNTWTYKLKDLNGEK